MERVIVESPFKGNIDLNSLYCRTCLHECFVVYNEAPFASHILYTQDGVLNDDVYSERMLGIEAGLLWGQAAEKTVVYVDLGISSGMCYGMENASKEGRAVVFRNLSPDRWGTFCRTCKKANINQENQYPLLDAAQDGSTETFWSYARSTLAMLRLSSNKI